MAAILIALSFFYLYAGVTRYEGEVQRLESIYRQEFNHVVSGIEKNMLGQYRTRLRNIAEVRTDIVEALASGDRDSLYRLILPLSKAFVSENPYLYVMHYHEPGGHSFLRMHKPEFFGDDLRQVRPALQFVHTAGRQATGFEIGRYGAFCRVIQPIYRENAMLGFSRWG